MSRRRAFASDHRYRYRYRYYHTTMVPVPLSIGPVVRCPDVSRTWILGPARCMCVCVYGSGTHRRRRGNGARPLQAVPVRQLEVSDFRFFQNSLSIHSPRQWFDGLLPSAPANMNYRYPHKGCAVARHPPEHSISQTLPYFPVETPPPTQHSPFHVPF